jgi:hypothetical protein
VRAGGGGGASLPQRAGNQVALAADVEGVAAALDAVHRLADHSHRPALEAELVEMQDGTTTYKVDNQ